MCACDVAGHDCSIRLWNLDSKTCVQEITSHRKKFDESIHDVAFHPSKPFIASAGADALAKVFAWHYDSSTVIMSVGEQRLATMNECRWFTATAHTHIHSTLWLFCRCSCTLCCRRDACSVQSSLMESFHSYSLIVMQHAAVHADNNVIMYLIISAEPIVYLYLKVCNWLTVSWSVCLIDKLATCWWCPLLLTCRISFSLELSHLVDESRTR